MPGQSRVGGNRVIKGKNGVKKVVAVRATNTKKPAKPKRPRK